MSSIAAKLTKMNELVQVSDPAEIRDIFEAAAPRSLY